MWELARRGARGTPFTEIGNYASLTEAALVISETEGTPLEPGFLRVYVDPVIDRSDAEILSHLFYQGAKHFYRLARSTH